MLRHTARARLAPIVADGSGPFVPHRILGLKPDASANMIKSRYFRLAKLYHPDMGGGAKADPVAFNDVSLAYKAMRAAKEEGKGSVEPDGSGVSDGALRRYARRLKKATEKRTPQNPELNDPSIKRRQDFRYHCVDAGAAANSAVARDGGGGQRESHDHGASAQKTSRQRLWDAAEGARTHASTAASGWASSTKAGQWLSTGVSSKHVVGASAAIPALIFMDPCGGTIVNAVFFGGLGAASVLAYQRFNGMRNSMISIMARFGALYRGIALGKLTYAAVDAVLRRWRTVFAAWLHRGGELTRFAKDMIGTIDAARRRARKVHAETTAKGAAAAAASGAGSFTSSAAASASRQHVGAEQPEAAADAEVPTSAAPAPGGTSSGESTTTDVSEAASAEPQVVSFTDGECVTGQPSGTPHEPLYEEDSMMMVTLPVPHGIDGAGGVWSSLPSGFGGGGAMVEPDDADIVLVQMPKLPAAATAAIETHCTALGERLKDLDAEAAFETAAALPMGFASTRLAFAGIRWLVNKVCSLLLRRAAERGE